MNAYKCIPLFCNVPPIRLDFRFLELQSKEYTIVVWLDLSIAGVVFLWDTLRNTLREFSELVQDSKIFFVLAMKHQEDYVIFIELDFK